MPTKKNQKPAKSAANIKTNTKAKAAKKPVKAVQKPVTPPDMGYVFNDDGKTVYLTICGYDVVKLPEAVAKVICDKYHGRMNDCKTCAQSAKKATAKKGK